MTAAMRAVMRGYIMPDKNLLDDILNVTAKAALFPPMRI